MIMSNSVFILHVILLISYTDNVACVVDEYRRDDFPTDFVFGSGTSAYQVEGAALEDGRTFSIWDTFAHSGGCSGANGDVACDGYHKYKDGYNTGYGLYYVDLDDKDLTRYPKLSAHWYTDFLKGKNTSGIFLNVDSKDSFSMSQ